ncbi:MAG: efflux RND transporter periplasmic adaptor subunit [Candidatus Xenobia bacterium]
MMVRMTVQRIGVLVVVAFLVIGAVFLSTHKTSTVSQKAATSSTNRSAMTVRVEAVAERPFHRTLEVTGSVQPIDPLSVGTEVNGLKIVQVLHEQGDVVHKGELLASLDASVLQAQIAQDVARLAAARATLSKTIQPNRPADIAGLRAAVNQARSDLAQQHSTLVAAEATLQNDRENYQRYQTLFRQGFVTVADTRNAETLVVKDQAQVQADKDTIRASEAAVAQADSKLQLGLLGGLPQDVQAAQANVQELQGEIQQLQAEIVFTRIVAPDDGVILQRNAHLGDIASSANPLFLMARRNELELRALVAEGDLYGLAVNQKVTVSGYDKSCRGHIWLVAPQVDGTTRQGMARIALPVGCPFVTGNFLRGVVEEGTRPVLTVPVSAVQGSSDHRYVFVYTGGIVHRTPVTLGQTQGDIIEVLSGLARGAQVVVEGAPFLTDGDRVSAGS